MDLEIVSCFLAEQLRSELGNRYTAVGIPMVLWVQDPAKPAPPLTCFMHLQTAGSGEAEINLYIREPRQKKTIYSRSSKIKTPAKSPEMVKDPDGFFNLMHHVHLDKLTFGHSGVFDVIVGVDKKARKQFRILVAVPPDKKPSTDKH